MESPPEIRDLRDIPGWFPAIDQHVFEHFLARDSIVPHGDLVEVGVYLGKSAVLIGRFRAADETFTVCDLFGMPASENSNAVENSRLYATLDRQRFEQNYLALFDELPVVIQALSSTIVDHVAPGSARFVHIDASHLYEHVAIDVDSAHKILMPDGVVAFDDYRSTHTPGVSAAVWEAVFTKGLRPICVTPQKLYGTFGDPQPHQQRLQAWLKEEGRYFCEAQEVGRGQLVRIRPKQVAAKPDPTGRRPQEASRSDRRPRNRDPQTAYRGPARPFPQECAAVGAAQAEVCLRPIQEVTWFATRTAGKTRYDASRDRTDAMEVGIADAAERQNETRPAGESRLPPIAEPCAAADSPRPAPSRRPARIVDIRAAECRHAGVQRRGLPRRGGRKRPHAELSECRTHTRRRRIHRHLGRRCATSSPARTSESG